MTDAERVVQEVGHRLGYVGGSFGAPRVVSGTRTAVVKVLQGPSGPKEYAASVKVN